jgi:hypothetical protein
VTYLAKRRLTVPLGGDAVEAPDPRMGSDAQMLRCVGLPAFVAGMLWYQSRQRAELARLLELK